jgi:hypothetical protein
VIRRLLCALWLVAWPAAAAFGQATAREGFRIETITVEGERRPATQGIVIEESRLVTGREWTERELREAIYRIRRLPFIVRADFTLRRGTARGLYALVVTVEETRPFFFARAAEFVSTSPEPVAEALGYGFGSGVNLRNAGTAGGRLFVGSRNALFASVDSNEGLGVGFTRYGLFGRGGRATLTLSSPLCCLREVLPLGLDPGLVVWSMDEAKHATLAIDVPLAGNHSLRTSLSWLRGGASIRRGLLDDFSHDQFFSGHDDLERRQAEVKWFYDTADDPLFPARGVTVSAGLELSQQKSPAPGAETEARLLAAAATGRKSWALSPRQTVSLGGRMAAGRSRIENLVTDGRILPKAVDLDSLETSVEARYSASLWGFEKTRNLGDLRAEMFVRAGYETTSPSFGGPVTQLSAGPALVFRNPWGVFRAAFTYLSLQRSRR